MSNHVGLRTFDVFTDFGGVRKKWIIEIEGGDLPFEKDEIPKILQNAFTDLQKKNNTFKLDQLSDIRFDYQNEPAVELEEVSYALKDRPEQRYILTQRKTDQVYRERRASSVIQPEPESPGASVLAMPSPPAPPHTPKQTVVDHPPMQQPPPSAAAAEVARPEPTAEENQWADSVKRLVGRSKYGSQYLEELEELFKQHEEWINKNFRQFGGTVFHMVAKQDDYLPCLPLLIKYHANFSLPDDVAFQFENTGLMWAIANAKNEMAMAILTQVGKQAALNHQDRVHRNTALHLAVAKGYTKLSSDNKPLKYSNLQLVEELVRLGANPNLKNKDGNTPLHLACARRDNGMIEALQRAGVDMTITNRQGKTPQDYLRRTDTPNGLDWDYSQVLQMLEDTVGTVFRLPPENFENAS